MPWAEPCVKPRLERWEVSPTHQHGQVLSKTNKNLSLSFSSLVLTHTYGPRAKLRLHMLQNSLKAHETEHHMILNTPTRQDDLRLSRRHMWVSRKDWVIKWTNNRLSEIVSLHSHSALSWQLASSWWNDTKLMAWVSHIIISHWVP